MPFVFLSSPSNRAEPRLRPRHPEEGGALREDGQAGRGAGGLQEGPGEGPRSPPGPGSLHGEP